MSDEFEWEDGPVIRYPLPMKDQSRRGLAAVPGSPLIATPALDADPLPAALSRIARIVSGTLELKEVFSQVAEVSGEVVPFEEMGVCRLVAPGSLRLYAIAGVNAADCESAECESGEDVRFQDFSPAIRPGQGAETRRINDAEQALDPAFRMDREILESGVRSALCCPLMSGKRHTGQVWFTSSRAFAFSEAHERAV